MDRAADNGITLQALQDLRIRHQRAVTSHVVKEHSDLAGEGDGYHGNRRHDEERCQTRQTRRGQCSAALELTGETLLQGQQHESQYGSPPQRGTQGFENAQQQVAHDYHRRDYEAAAIKGRVHDHLRARRTGCAGYLRSCCTTGPNSERLCGFCITARTPSAVARMTSASSTCPERMATLEVGATARTSRANSRPLAQGSDRSVSNSVKRAGSALKADRASPADVTPQ